MSDAAGGRRCAVAGVILAAGSASRMGQPKQLLPLAGRPLLQHVVEAAAMSGLDDVVLVLGHRAEAIRRAIDCPPGVRVVVNPDHAQGQSTSLRLGLGALSPRAAAAAILLGDQPRVGAGLIDRVAAAFQAGTAAVVRPTYCGGGQRVPGHPVVIARHLWPALDALRGDQGARALIAAHPEWLHEVELDGVAPGDVDTWADYQAEAEVAEPRRAGRARTAAGRS